MQEPASQQNGVEKSSEGAVVAEQLPGAINHAERGAKPGDDSEPRTLQAKQVNVSPQPSVSFAADTSRQISPDGKDDLRASANQSEGEEQDKFESELTRIDDEPNFDEGLNGTACAVLERRQMRYTRTDAALRSIMVLNEAEHEAKHREHRRMTVRRSMVGGPEGSSTCRSSIGSKISEGSEEGTASFWEVMSLRDWLITGIMSIVVVIVVVAMCLWAEEGLLAEHEMGHAVLTDFGHMHSRLFTTPATIDLHGTGKEYFEVRLVAMSTKAFDTPHRRLAGTSFIQPGRSSRRHGLNQALRSLSGVDTAEPVVGNLTYTLLADGQEFFSKTLKLRGNIEIEHFNEVDVGELATNFKGCNEAKKYTSVVTATRSDGKEVAFFLQVVRMSAIGRHRVVLGVITFIITFAGIVSEKIHRSYCAFLGVAITLCLLAAIQETPHLSKITGMIDFGTMMLLFSMMILMRMLAVTGFFNWFAVKVVQVSNQNVTFLFFLLTNLCGVLSMVLDNVTCVLLMGPLTFSLAKKLSVNPRPIYLAMTICATVGGTATLIGDPPNIVIGLKLKVGFEKFLICNLPITVVLLPLCSVILYYRLRHTLFMTDGIDSLPAGTPRPRVDLVKLARENKIVDPAGFAKLGVILLGVLFALLLSPVHKIEPGWFTVMAMFISAIIFEPDEFGKFLEFVEWDTLLFFALLFVFVESLAELGVIRSIAACIVDFIQVFPEESQLGMSIVIILWVSTLGSAFLESLPYTTTMVAIIKDLMMRSDELPGMKPAILIWPLSVGACVGGIGSIMGSSANLVCMAVSKRFTDNDAERVQGGDFLKYGFPTLLILMCVVTVFQLTLFVALDYEP